MEMLEQFYATTGFASMNLQSAIMIVLGLVFLFLAIRLKYEPLLLVPIGLGMVLGNIPYDATKLALGAKQEGSVFYYLYQGVQLGIYPPLIFLGIGAMTDFSSMIANPKLLGYMRQTAEKNNIPYQLKTQLGGGTDGGQIHIAGGGRPTSVISMPCRYIHSPAALLSKTDYANALKLAQAALHGLTFEAFRYE